MMRGRKMRRDEQSGEGSEVNRGERRRGGKERRRRDRRGLSHQPGLNNTIRDDTIQLY